MSLKELEALIDNGQYQKVLTLLSEMTEQKTFDSQSRKEQMRCLYYKSRALECLGKLEKALQVVVSARLDLRFPQDYLVALLLISAQIRALERLGRFDEALAVAKDGETIIQKLSEEDYSLGTKNIALFYNRKGALHYHLGELDVALEYLQKSLKLFEKLIDPQQFNQTITYSIARLLNNLGLIYHSKGQLDQALDHLSQCLSLFQKIGNEQSIGRALNNLGLVYRSKGELDKALEYYQKGLALFEKSQNMAAIAILLTNIGLIYLAKDQIATAFEKLEQSLEIKIDRGDNISTAYTLFYLFLLSLEQGKMERARAISNQLQQLYETTPNKKIHLRSRLVEALLLKTSPRSRNRAKAEQLLIAIAEEEEIIDHEITVEALLHLCEFLLTELQMTNDPEVLEEIEEYLLRLQTIARDQNSYWLLAETLWFKSKLSLLTLDIQAARRLLTQAQDLAEKWGLRRLAIKISTEHDELLEQTAIWEELKQKNASLAERSKYAGLQDFVNPLIWKKAREVPELSKERPIMLLILDEGGSTRFSKSFVSIPNKINEQLIGGFLTAIRSFSSEIFDQTVDRVKLEEYTLLIKAEPPFVICYVFTGQTYTALQKLKQFAKEIQNNSKVWTTLIKSRDESRVLTHFPLLEDLFSQIFIDQTLE